LSKTRLRYEKFHDCGSEVMEGYLTMTRFISYILVCVFVTILDCPVFAADTPGGSNAVPTAPWTGVYIGGHIGFGAGRTHWDNESTTSAVPDFGPGAHITSHRTNGFIGGAHLGINYQLGALVFGIEPEYSGATLHGKSSSNLIPGDDRYSTRIRGLLSAAARVGYATDKWLTYLKVGYASGNVKTRLEDHTGVEQGSESNSELHHGFIMGPGLEYMLGSNIVLGAEYNYLDLGEKKHKLGGAGTSLAGTIVNKVDVGGIHRLNVRVSYLFNWQ
jgi:outer membrane immunogenic protein